MTSSEAETRRLRAAFASTSPDDVNTGDCPRPERIWDAVRNALPRPEARAILEHVAACALCTEAWRLAREIDDGDASEKSEGLEEPPSSSYGRFAAAGAVAAILAYFLVGASVQDLSTGGAIARSTVGGDLRLTSSDSLPRASCNPAWTRIDGALYDVEVSDENLELVTAVQGLSSPALQVAEADLPADGSLLLYILAYDEADGTPLAERTLELECAD